MSAPQGGRGITNRGVIGETHGELTLISTDAPRGAEGRVAGVWRCSCGVEKIIPIGRVRRGTPKSCGHLTREAKPGLKHGMRGTKEYRAWCNAKSRCHNPNSKDFASYGGAGITFNEEWRDDFESFLRHIGPCPSPSHQIDRIDTTSGYEPGNVRWATIHTQARNKRSTYVWTINGKTFGSAQEAADYSGVSVQTVWRWVNGQMNARRGSLFYKRDDCYATPRY